MYNSFRVSKLCHGVEQSSPLGNCFGAPNLQRFDLLGIVDVVVGGFAVGNSRDTATEFLRTPARQVGDRDTQFLELGRKLVSEHTQRL